MHKFEDLVWEFMYDCEIRKLTKQTLRGYRNQLLYFNKFLLSKDIIYLEDVTTQVIKMYINMQVQKGLKATYLNTGIKVLKVFYKWAVVEEYALPNNDPTIKIRFVSGDKPLIQTFNNEEVKGMMNAYKGSSFLELRNKAIMALLFDTGVRNSEICNLSIDAVKDNYLLIWGKGNKERVVPKSAYLSKALVRYERARNDYFELRPCDETRYFLSRTGKPLTVASIERVVEFAGKFAGVRPEIRCSPHTCRHYYAQSQLLNGNDMYTISRLLGHSNISITKTYIQSMRDEEVINKAIEFSPLMNLKG